MNWLKNILSDAKAVLQAPFINILCGGGIFLVFASFVDYDKVNGLSLQGNARWAMLASGLVLVVVSGILFFLTQKVIGTLRTLNYGKGVAIKRGELTIFIKTGEIQTIQEITCHSAIVLPANTTFVDDCAADRRTAMGAFFTERFPEEIGKLSALLKEVLDGKGIRPAEGDQYAPGTTVLLPDRFAKPARVVVTASTTRTPGAGIVSTPHIICNCVEEILRITADQRVDTIHMPILGSGHGGVERGMALMFLLLAILHFSKLYHHIRKVHIVVHPEDVNGLNESKELRQILAL